MEDTYLEKVCACALNRVFGYEPAISRTLIENLGSAKAVFDLSDDELGEVFGPYSKHRGKLGKRLLDEADRELTALSARGCTFVAMTGNDYPQLLLDCDDPPAGLYVRCSSPLAEVFNAGPGISVVGTRDISPYGSEWCARLVGAMSGAVRKPVVVSGLAIGVDICAHMAALAYGLPTIAVIPCGIDDIYPRRHRVAAEKIAAAPGGAIVTDYPPGTSPQPVCFLRRNRIIAGLGTSTVLVESKAKGGGTMTARLAYGYGREVFALPGRIDDLRSEGCNLLIREKIAEPIVSLPEFVGALGLGKFSDRGRPALEDLVRDRYSGSLDKAELGRMLTVAGLVRKRRGISLEEICRESGYSYSDVASCAGMLENDGFISIDLLQRCTIDFKNV